MFLFTVGLVVGAIAQYLYAETTNTCICTDCRRARWYAGKRVDRP